MVDISQTAVLDCLAKAIRDIGTCRNVDCENKHGETVLRKCQGWFGGVLEARSDGPKTSSRVASLLWHHIHLQIRGGSAEQQQVFCVIQVEQNSVLWLSSLRLFEHWSHPYTSFSVLRLTVLACLSFQRYIAGMAVGSIVSDLRTGRSRGSRRNPSVASSTSARESGEAKF